MGFWDNFKNSFTSTAPQAAAQGAATSSFGSTMGGLAGGKNPLFNTLIQAGLGGAAQLFGNDLKSDELALLQQQQAFKEEMDRASLELQKQQLAQALEIAGMQAGVQMAGVRNNAFSSLLQGNQAGRTNEATALRDMATLMQNGLR